ncbi:hypothetical protein Tco_0969524 [Tanacetum coccineum]
MMRMNFLMHASDVVHETSNLDLRRIAMGLRVDVFNFLGWRGKVDKRWFMTLCRGGEGLSDYKDTLPGFLRLVRNTRSHILENTPDDYTLEEFEGYIRKTYPKLVPEVYKLLERNYTGKKL